MFREMRRTKQALSENECVDILKRGTAGVLALSGDGGYPYAVPLSYSYEDGELLFHGATAGHKIDAMRKDPKASFCVIDKNDVVPEEYTSHFRSVIAFGRISIVEDENEKIAEMSKLAERFRPGFGAETNAKSEDAVKRFCLFKLKIEHMSGKQSLALANK